MALAGLCVLAASCGGTTAGPKAVVNASAVPRIVAAYSAANNRSNAALSQPDQASDEQGSALALDDAAYALEARAGFVTADGNRYYPFNLVPTEVSVPRQTGYPARFEAVLRTKPSPGTPASYRCAGGSEVGVFVKDSAGAPWRAALEPQVSTRRVPPLARGAGGFAPAVEPAQQSQAATVPSGLARALALYARTGRLSDGLTESDFGMAGKCWSIDNLRADVIAEGANDVVETVSVSVYTPDDLTVVPLAPDHGVLAVFSLEIGTSFRARTAGEAIGWPHSSSDPLEDVVPPGAYSSVTVPEICEIAAIVPPTGGGATSVVGADCGPLVGKGKKATAGQIVPSRPPSGAVLVSRAIGR